MHTLIHCRTVRRADVWPIFCSCPQIVPEQSEITIIRRKYSRKYGMSDGKWIDKISSAISGFYVYEESWNPVPGEQLDAEREPGDPEDSFAVCMKISCLPLRL